MIEADNFHLAAGCLREANALLNSAEDLSKPVQRAAVTALVGVGHAMLALAERMDELLTYAPGWVARKE